MITQLLARILYPGHQPWKRERETRVILAAIIIALLFASLIGTIMYWRNGFSKF